MNVSCKPMIFDYLDFKACNSRVIYTSHTLNVSGNYSSEKMTLETIKSKLSKKGLGGFFEKLEPEIRKSIKIQLTDVDSTTPGTSRIGGTPDLPPEFEWPSALYEKAIKKFFGLGKSTKTKEEKPMSFIAQLNLSELQGMEVSLDLPSSGMLYFFYDSDQSVWGFDPKDESKFKVFFYSGDLNKLKNESFPENLNEEGKFTGTNVKFNSEISLPSTDSELYEELSDSDQDWFFDEFYPDEEINKIGGYSDTIQGDMELECELVTNGLYCGDPSGYNDPKAKELEPNAKNWRLLLQIDSNEKLEMMWGDSGRLYFWIRQQDLEEANFQKSWMCLQCY